jgi:putative PEP-CTERM system histidine kinase
MISFATLSYGTAAAGFVLLTILLLTSWRGRRAGTRLIAACGLSAVWAAGLALDAAGVAVTLLGVHTLETARNAGWIIVLAGLARGVLPRFLIVGSHALWIGMLVAGWGTQALESRGVHVGDLGTLLVRGGLAVAIVVLVLLEQLYRNASSAGRYGLKSLALGLGGLYAYDLFLYSQAELLRGVSIESWAARGFIAALLVPAIAIAARRNPDWSLDVFVSRQVVTYSTMIVVAGLYLVMMALGGFYIREVGGAWGPVAQIVFLGGAGVVLTALLVSGTIRRRLKVFISKHFYRNKYDYRLEWLRFVDTLSGSDEEDPRRRGLQAIAQIFNCPGGVLLQFDDRDQQAVPVAAWPMEVSDFGGLEPIRSDTPLVSFVRGRGWVIDLDEYRLTPEVYQNTAVPEWLTEGGRFRILAPLFAGRRLAGFAALYPPPPPFDLTFEDRDLLKTVGRHVATHVAQHMADRRLAESRQFEAYNRLTAFMMHDLKNAIAQLQLVVSNAAKHKRNPEFVDDAMLTVGGTVDRLVQLVGHLRGGGNGNLNAQADLAAAVDRAVGRCGDRPPAPVVAGELPRGLMVQAEQERLASVLEHVIRNAQDATGGSGAVAVSLERAGAEGIVTVTDTGCGMSDEFLRERLFRPFDSTKGAKGMGIGAYQVREFALSLGGDVEVQSSPGAGTRFSIRVPCSPSQTGPGQDGKGRTGG